MSLNKKKNTFIIISVLLASVLMIISDGVIKPTYFYKSLTKICLFVSIPLIYFLIMRDDLGDLKKLFTPKKRSILIPLSIGVGVYAVIICGYFIFRNFIDFNSIVDSLVGDLGVTKDNFVYVAIYISTVNSFLEEMFFRGYAFTFLNKYTTRSFAYIFSALIFAIYHVGIIDGWFNFGIHILTILGLFIGGCIFNYMNEKFENIYSSWIVHAFANFAINSVGFIVFGLV